MKKMNLRKTLALTVTTALALTLLTGCGASQTMEMSSPVAESKVAGTVLLSINPEIKIEYDEHGFVLEIEGMNDDGKTVTAEVAEYKGKECKSVVNELVQKIYEAGFFAETVDGHAKNIILKLEEGSAYPDDDFLESIADEAREAVKAHGIGSAAMTIQKTDLDDNGYINLEKAKELVLAQLGVVSASFRDHEYELDDGVYEFEFSANGIEYEYEVDARTGKVLEADFEGNDDWNALHGQDDDQDDDDRDDDQDDDDRDDGQDDDRDDDRDDDQDDDLADDDRDDDRDDDDRDDDDRDDDRDDGQDDDRDDGQDDDQDDDDRAGDDRDDDDRDDDDRDDDDRDDDLDDDDRDDDDRDDDDRDDDDRDDDDQDDDDRDDDDRDDDDRDDDQDDDDQDD